MNEVWHVLRGDLELHYRQTKYALEVANVHGQDRKYEGHQLSYADCGERRVLVADRGDDPSDEFLNRFAATFGRDHDTGIQD
jgi:hypothetical protein